MRIERICTLLLLALWASKTYTSSRTTPHLETTMAVSLTQPSIGSTGWGAAVNTNFAAIQAALNNPTCRCGYSSSTSITNNTYAVAIAFDGTDAFDTDSMHDPSSDNSKIFINTTGIYLVGGMVSFALNGSGRRYLELFTNGSAVITNTQVDPDTDGNPTNIGISTIWSFSAGDWVQLRAYQNSGGNLATQNANFWAVRVAVL